MIQQHIEAVRSLATAIDQLASVNVPELTVTDDMVVDEPTDEAWIDVERDEDWWAAWVELYEIVEDTIGNVKAHAGPDNMMRPDVDPHRRRMEIKAETDFTALSVRVYASGDLGILAEYKPANKGAYKPIFEGRISNNTVNGVELGRKVATIELSILVEATGSRVEALDYYMTEIHNTRPQEWADISGDDRDAVSSNAQSAKDAIEEG